MLLKNARRLVILCTAILLTNPLTVWIVGRINRLLGRPLCTMFVGYAASTKYREAYAFSFMLPWIRYTPMIVGLFIQNGRLGIIAMTSSVEPDFLSPVHLDRLHEGCHRIAERLGIEEVNFSGILPTAFRRAGLMTELHHQSRCRVVGRVVTDAAIRTAEAHDIDTYLPIVLLGGRGSVGRAVATELGRRGRTCFIVDLNDRWPEHLRGERILLVDVSKRGALERRTPQLWEGVVVLKAGNRASEVAAIVFDLAPPSIQDAFVGYRPSTDNHLANPTAARAGTTVSLSIVADETIEAPPTTIQAAGPSGSVLDFGVVPGSVNAFGARYEATVTNANRDGPHIPTLRLVDLAGNATDLTLAGAPIEVSVSPPVLTVDQSLVSYVRAPAGMGAPEALGSYTIPAGPNYFALAPPDGLTDAATLPAGTFRLGGSVTPTAVRVYSDAQKTNLVSGVLTPLPNGQWDRDDLRLFDQDASSVFVTGIDPAGNESAAVLVENAWYVASSANGPNGTPQHLVTTWRRPAPPLSGGNVVPPTAALSSPDLSTIDAIAGFDLVEERDDLPPGRNNHGFAFDSGRGRAVVFGGQGDEFDTFADTWEWDGNRWLERSPIQSPTARRHSSMTYDPVLGVVLLFGGAHTFGTQVFADTWAWDGSEWTELTPTTPVAVEDTNHTLAFDSARGRTTLFLTTQNSPAAQWSPTAGTSIFAPSPTSSWSGTARTGSIGRRPTAHPRARATTSSTTPTTTSSSSKGVRVRRRRTTTIAGASTGPTNRRSCSRPSSPRI